MANEGIFDNRLLQQALLSAGSALNPQGISPALQQSMQPVIGAQSQAELQQKYMTMMRDMLEGRAPEGSKMTMDDKGAKFELPKSALAGPQKQQQAPLPTQDIGQWTRYGGQEKGNGMLNPFWASLK